MVPTTNFRLLRMTSLNLSQSTGARMSKYKRFARALGVDFKDIMELVSNMVEERE